MTKYKMTRSGRKMGQQVGSKRSTLAVNQLACSGILLVLSIIFASQSRSEALCWLVVGYSLARLPTISESLCCGGS